eukprot:gene1533-1669_t
MNALTEKEEEVKEEKTIYRSQYESHLCLAEVIRNICVNIGIDPDTVDGYTRNVIVYHKEENVWQPWRYSPGARLGTCSSGGRLELIVEELTPCCDSR